MRVMEKITMERIKERLRSHLNEPVDNKLNNEDTIALNLSSLNNNELIQSLGEFLNEFWRDRVDEPEL